MKLEGLPDWLNNICEKLYKLNVFPSIPNHVLINEYKRDEGISYHKDGPLYFPRVAIITLNGSSLINFKRELKQSHEFSLFLKPKSLLIFDERCYNEYYHGIEENLYDTLDEKVINLDNDHIGTHIERTLRVSLTIRIVPRILNVEEP